MANKIRIDTRLLNVNWTTATSYRLELGSSLVREVGNNRSFSAAQPNADTFTTFESGPTISSVSPAVGTTGSFATTASITFNRKIFESPSLNNISLYREVVGGTDQLIATLTTASSRVTRIDNTLSINLKDLIDGNSTYYLQTDSAIYIDMFRFANENLSENNFKYSTGRPNIDDVVPDYLTTGSFATNPVISFDRNVKKRTGNFYLYKKTSGADALIQTFNTSDSRVVVDGDDVSFDLRYLLEGSSTYYLAGDDAVLDDVITNFRAEQIGENNFKYSTGPGPVPVSITPAYNSTGTFVSTATITFDKPVSLYSNNVYLYNDEGAYRTIAANNSSLRIINSNTLEITLFNQPIPEDTYWIGFDLGTIIDANTFSAVPVVDDSLVKWTSKSITDIANDDYNSRITTPIFENNWFNVLDRSPNANEPYTLTMSATSGTFTATGGISVGNTWIYTGTNQQISNIGGVNFIANVKDMNWDLPIETTLKKQGTIVATRNNTIIGLPYDLDSMPLVSNSYTNIISSATILTVSANTNSQFNGVDSGYVTFKAGTATIGISTFSNNISTLSLPAGQLPVGTYNIYADWAGRIIPPKFNGTLSNTISQTILPKSTITFAVSSIADFFYHNLDGATLAQYSTATITLTNIYPNAKPSGTINIYDGATLLGSDTLELVGNTSTGVITWTPATSSQLDQGTRNIRFEYSGDDWNSTGTTTSTFAARTRRQAILNLTSNTTTYVRPTNITLNVATTATFNNKQLSFVASTGTFGSGTFNASSSSFTFDSRILSTGSNSVYAAFAQDFSFVSTNSNAATFTISKGTYPITISKTTATVYKPYDITFTSTSQHSYQSAGIGYYFNNTLNTSSIISGTSNSVTVNSMQFSTGTYTVLSKIEGDDNYNSVSTSTTILVDTTKFSNFITDYEEGNSTFDPGTGRISFSIANTDFDKFKDEVINIKIYLRLSTYRNPETGSLSPESSLATFIKGPLFKNKNISMSPEIALGDTNLIYSVNGPGAQGIRVNYNPNYDGNLLSLRPGPITTIDFSTLDTSYYAFPVSDFADRFLVDGVEYGANGLYFEITFTKDGNIINKVEGYNPGSSLDSSITVITSIISS